MNAVAVLALNDLRLAVRDRAAFLWMLVLPVAMMWFFGGLGGGDAGPQRISIGLDDRDGGWLARALVEELADERVDLRPLAREGLPSAEPERKVRTLVVPERFTERVLAGERQALRLEIEPDADAGFSIAARVHIVRAIVRTLARLVEMGETQARDPAALERFRELARRPALVDLDVRTAGRGRPVPGGLAQSVPGILTMMVLMMTLIYGGVFLTLEKGTGMLRRQAGLPLGRLELLGGKLLGRLLMVALQATLLLLAGRFVFGVSWGDSPLGLALLLGSFALAVAGLSTLLGALARTAAQASSVGWILSMVLGALGGCWWPGELMPAWLRAAAHVLPTAWAMDGFHALISFGRGADAVLLPSAVLLGFGVVFTLLGARFLRYV